ncbi:MAG: hypothetical protein OXB92_17505 [Acidimicrobiaceae bacterium]|nr:hypothetical protein [Acidimicrobiaceae bacterium]
MAAVLGWALPVLVTGVLSAATGLGWTLPVLVRVTGVLSVDGVLGWGLLVLVTGVVTGLGRALLVVVTGVVGVLGWAVSVVVGGIVPGVRGGLGVAGRGLGCGFWRYWWWWVRCWGWCRKLRCRRLWRRMVRAVV